MCSKDLILTIDMTNNFFHLDVATLSDITQQLIAMSLKKGATACDAEVSEGSGLTVTIRLGQIEMLEYHQDKNFTVTVYIGKRRGQASGSDFSVQALSQAVDIALDIARFTAQDDFSGLIESSMLCQSFIDLDLFSPWSINVDQAVALAKTCERAGQDVSAKIVNSDGATLSTQTHQFIYANSLGFCAGYPTSCHRILASFIAEQDGAMQTDSWMSVASCPDELDSAEQVGKIAGNRTIQRLGAKQIKTGQYPVLFASPVSNTLMAYLVEALSGDKLYRQSSFLLDSLGTQLMPSWMNLIEDPFVLRGLGSCPFDAEGSTVKKRLIIEKGCVAGYFLDSYAARRLNMKSTGNAGGSHNIVLQHSHATLDELIQEIAQGVIVTELMGDGVNLVTGDYSQGAVGFWIEKGKIAYPIQEITIAGNLRQMLHDIIAVANDAVIWGSQCVGSILIKSMTVAGKNNI